MQERFFTCFQSIHGRLFSALACTPEHPVGVVPRAKHAGVAERIAGHQRRSHAQAQLHKALPCTCRCSCRHCRRCCFCCRCCRKFGRFGFAHQAHQRTTHGSEVQTQRRGVPNQERSDRTSFYQEDRKRKRDRVPHFFKNWSWWARRGSRADEFVNRCIGGCDRPFDKKGDMSLRAKQKHSTRLPNASHARRLYVHTQPTGLPIPRTPHPPPCPLATAFTPFLLPFAQIPFPLTPYTPATKYFAHFRNRTSSLLLVSKISATPPGHKPTLQPSLTLRATFSFSALWHPIHVITCRIRGSLQESDEGGGRKMLRLLLLTMVV